MSKRVFLVGVGPGSPKYLTDVAKDAITRSKSLIGYRYTLATIKHLIDPKFHQVYEVTIKNQDLVYNEVFKKMKNGEFCTITFTGDVNFSESEVVGRLITLFGNENVELIPGISSIQIAASKAKIPLDKATVLSFHITEDIENLKKELVNAIQNKKSIILLPRPWPNCLSKQFMESDIALFLKNRRINTSELVTWVFEFLTSNEEIVYKGKLNELEGIDFDPLSVMVIDQVAYNT